MHASVLTSLSPKPASKAGAERAASEAAAHQVKSLQLRFRSSSLLTCLARQLMTAQVLRSLEGQDGVPGCWLQPGPTTPVAAICGVNQRMEKSFSDILHFK